MNEQQQGNPVFLMMPGASPQLPSASDEPPARIMAAMAFLSSITMKQMTRAAFNDHVIQEIDPPELTTSERNAQASACNMLNEYFLGKLEPNLWEVLQIKGKVQRGEGMILRCIACQGTTPYGCNVCKGTGRVIVYSSAEGGQQ